VYAWPVRLVSRIASADCFSLFQLRVWSYAQKYLRITRFQAFAFQNGSTCAATPRYFEDPEADAEEESQEVVDAFFKDAAEEFGDESLRLKKQFAGREKSGDGGSGANNW
jgi:hypothetical protein